MHTKNTKNDLARLVMGTILLVTSLPGDATVLPQSCDLAAQVCVALLLLISLLLLLLNHFLVRYFLGLAKPSGVSLKLSGLLASLFAVTSNLGSQSSHLA